MGASACGCSKGQQPETVYDLTTRENLLIDSLVIPNSNCKKLKYLNDFQNKFNILRHFQLVDFINLLNYFRPDSEGQNSAYTMKFKDAMINKDDWMRFIDTKIVKSPLIPEIDSVAQGLQSQFYDDVFDCLLRIYKTLFGTEHNFIPKLIIISFVFNYCGMKVSQKIDIFLNLFCDSEGNITISNSDIYTFLFSLITFAFAFPTEYLTKFNDVDNNKKYYGLNSVADLTPFKEREIREEITLKFLGREIKKMFGEDESKSYDRQDFKKFVMDTTSTGGIWIIDNAILRQRIEEGLE